MTPDAPQPLERAYPYWPGLGVTGCTAFGLGLMGAAGAAMFPFGCQQMNAGKLPLAIALFTIGLFTAPMLLLALLSLGSGFVHLIRPPLLRVTSTALRLPKAARGASPPNEGDERTGLPQPEEIPFSAIRGVRREGKFNPGNDRLVIVHDLASTTLEIEQSMMRREDFDELETVLRAASPAAFAPAPNGPDTKG